MNLDFRPRPIDVYKPLQISIQSDYVNDDSFRSAASVKTGMEKEEEQEEHFIKAISAKPLIRRVTFIPTPFCKDLSDYREADIDIPVDHIVYHEPTTQEEYEFIHYDMDDEDFDFLERCNRRLGATRHHGQNEIKELKPELFERIIDRLEKEKELQNEIPSSSSVEKMFDIPPSVFQAVYQHWLHRKKEMEVPLLERLRPPPDPDDPSPLIAFRPRSSLSERNFKLFGSGDAIQQRLSQLLDDLVSVKKVFNLMKKRERKKLEITKIRNSIFNSRMKEVERSGQARERQPRTFKRSSGIVATPEIIPLDLDSAFFSPIYSSDDSNYSSDTDSSAFTDEESKDKLSIDPFSRMPSSMNTPVVQSVEEDSEKALNNIRLMFEVSSTLNSVVESSGGKNDGISTPMDPSTRLFPEKHASGEYFEKPRIGRGGRVIFDRTMPSESTQQQSHVHVVYPITPH